MASNSITRDHHLWTRDTIKNVSGDVTLDIAGDITLDAGGGDVNVLQADLTLPSSKKLILGAAEEYIYGDGTDIHFGVGSGGDINIPTSIGLTFASDTEKIESNGVYLSITSGGNIRLTPVGEIDCGSSTLGFTAQTATGDGTTTIDWGEGNKFHFTFGGQDDTITFGTNPAKPCNLLMKIKQDGTGSRTINWEVTSGTIYWAGGGTEDSGSEPTLTTSANEVDIITFYFDGTNYYGVASLDFDA